MPLEGSQARLPPVLQRVHPNLYVQSSFFNPRRRSLIRGSVLVLLSLWAAFQLSDFPHNRPTFLLAIPSLVAMVGTADTIRCMQRRWNFYHGGVVLCIYMDLMAVSMILFFFLYPYMFWLSATH